jgi:hypothetical protein
MELMKPRLFAHVLKVSAICGLLFFHAPRLLMAEPSLAALSAFSSYTHSVESRLGQQHKIPNSFLALPFSDAQGSDTRLRNGELIVEKLTPSTGSKLSGSLLHHWRGTAFAPGATAADFERLMRDFKSYPQHFSPQVIQARTLSQNGDRVEARMRVRQHHVITVVMDTTYDVQFGQLDAQHGYSISKSTRIAEIESPGSNTEHVLNAGQEHGFLYQLNTYWSYEERDGGLYMQIESISLTRSIPTGLGWVIRPYIESIPRESLEFTLRAACNAIRK